MPEPAGVVAQAAARLRDAAARRVPCAPVRDIAGTSDVRLAYQIQAANIGRELAAGRRRVGRKIGLTSPAVQQQLGVNQPDFGTLLDSMALRPGGDADMGGLLQPKVEGEIAFWLGADLDGELGGVEDIRPAVAAAAAAIEIVDSRILGWDITIVDTVADNASSGLFVTSAGTVPLTAFEPREVIMNLTVNGQVVSAGTGSACLGDPLTAVLWLARAAAAVGEPLRAGEVVLSGALGPMVPVAAGDQVSVEISALGTVAVRFTGEDGADG